VGVGVTFVLYSLIKDWSEPFFEPKLFWKIFDDETGNPGTINLDPLNILPDVGLLSSPILYYRFIPPNNHPYFM
jgi:hypothetical protein